MTVGSPTSTADGSKKNSLRFVCLTDKNTRFPETAEFPTTKCKGGIMTTHHFPGKTPPAPIAIVSDCIHRA